MRCLRPVTRPNSVQCERTWWKRPQLQHAWISEEEVLPDRDDIAILAVACQNVPPRVSKMGHTPRQREHLESRIPCSGDAQMEQQSRPRAVLGPKHLLLDQLNPAVVASKVGLLIHLGHTHCLAIASYAHFHHDRASRPPAVDLQHPLLCRSHLGPRSARLRVRW